MIRSGNSLGQLLEAWQILFQPHTLMTTREVVCERSAQFRSSAAPPGLYRAYCDPQQQSCSARGFLLQVAELQSPACCRSQFIQSCKKQRFSFSGQTGRFSVWPRIRDLQRSLCFLLRIDFERREFARSRSFSSPHACLVHGNADQPRRKGRLALKRGELYEYLHEGLLGNVLGIVGVAGHPLGNRENSASIPPNKHLEACCIAGSRRCHERVLRACARCGRRGLFFQSVLCCRHCTASSRLVPIKPDIRRRMYWTKVLINTFVSATRNCSGDATVCHPPSNASFRIDWAPRPIDTNVQ